MCGPWDTTGPQTLTLHWDGTTWTTVPSPNVGSASQLTSASSSPGAAIVWDAGYSGVSGSFNPSPFGTAEVEARDRALRT